MVRFPASLALCSGNFVMTVAIASFAFVVFAFALALGFAGALRRGSVAIPTSLGLMPSFPACFANLGRLLSDLLSRLAYRHGRLPCRLPWGGRLAKKNWLSHTM